MPAPLATAATGRQCSVTARGCLMRCLHLLRTLLLAAASVAGAAEFGLQLRDAGDASGAEVSVVAAGSSAATAGVRPGDIVRRLEQTPVTGADQFSSLARSLPAGKPVTLRISRQGWERDILLPAEAARPTPPRFGLRLAEAAAGVQPAGSVAIANVLANTPAARAGLQPGDIVTRIDGRQPAGASQLVRLLQEAAAASRPLRLAVRRDGWEKEVLLSPGPMPAGLTTAEWNDADQLAAAAAPAPAAAASKTAADPAVRAPVAEAPAAAQARAELLAMDDAGYRTYKADLEVADARYESGDWQEAERHYRQAIARVPSEAQSWARLGHALLMQQRFADAVRACRKALDLGGPRAENLNNLGLAYFELEALAQARDAYLKAIETAPGWPLPYAGLALVHFTRKDWPEAEKYYRLALERDPGHADYRQMLDAARQRQGEAATAGEKTPDAAAPPSGTAAQQPAAMPVATAVEPAARPAVRANGVAPAEAVPVGRKAMIAIGEFMVKAAGAGQFVGDGLREMMMTTMHENGRFIVVERLDLQGLAAEQALSRSPLARPDAVIAERQMDVAEIMVSAAVTEFELEASGSGLELGVPKIPLTFGHQSRNAHLAIDVRVIDIATGRVLGAKRIEGKASASQTSIGATLSRRGTAIPVSLGGFRNTPMEAAIRDCVQKASEYITSSTPRKYFRHD